MNYPDLKFAIKRNGRGLAARLGAKAVIVLVLVLVVWSWAPRTVTLQAGPLAQQAAQAPAGERPFAVRVAFGASEKWSGRVSAEDARIVEARGWQTLAADRVTGESFELEADQRPRAPIRKGAILRGAGGRAARILVQTGGGVVSFQVWDLALGREVGYLEERVRVERLLYSERLSDGRREDDYPAIAVAPDGTAWAAWQSYGDGRDEVRVAKYAGAWRTFTPVPGASGDVWRPQLAFDASKRLWVVWCQQVGGNFDVYARALDEARQSWSELVRISSDPLPDIEHHIVADSRGVVWVVWQGFRGRGSDIFLRSFDGREWSREVRVTEHPSNDWEPRLAVDRNGRAHIAWDTYRNGNYDVYMRTFESGRLGPEVAVAATARFEAHASIAVDGGDRVWVAWDEGGTNWGKDTGLTDDPRWSENPRESFDNWVLKPAYPGTRLYDERRVNLAVFQDGRREVPAQDLRAALTEAAIPAHDYPQFFVDPRSGRIVLLFHRWSLEGQFTPNMESRQIAAWEHALVAYEGDRWGPAITLPESQGRPSMRSSAAFSPDGSLWAVWPSDGRVRRAPYQAVRGEIFAARVPLEGAVREVQLRSAGAPEQVEAPAVHPTGAEDVAAIRAFRTFAGGAELRIVRGDLHRHTEFSADNGGLRDGSLLDFYRYMLDAAGMDFGAVTDHNAGADYDYWWWLTEKTADMFHVPGAYTTLYGYERSVQFPMGHRNVFHTRRGVPVVPFFTQAELTGQRPPVAVPPNRILRDDTRLLYSALRASGGISIPHTTGSFAGTDWRDNDREVEPAVEIYQGARVSYEHPGGPRALASGDQIRDFREPGFVWNAYRKGYRLGTIASSDHFSTHISYAMVYAESESREAIFEAIRKRRTYGATDNIVLECRMGEHFMGEEFSAAEIAPIQVRVIGTAPVAKVEIIRNEQVIYSASPGKKDVTLTFQDRNTVAGESYRYYVRVTQADGENAWGSPMWVTLGTTPK
jgi:hypothetical protein